MSGQEYRFVIEDVSRETLPMERLAAYMAALARLFGAARHVHFLRLEAGSTVLVQAVAPDVLPGVQERIHAAVQGRPPESAARAIAGLDRLLAEDGTTGSLRESDGAELLRFPAREHAQPLAFGPFVQEGTLDGMLIRVGGRDDTVPVHLQDGAIFHNCNATREMAQKLAPYLYGATLRVHGDGRWWRDGDGAWRMERFDIASFQLLDETPLGAVVGQLREVPGSGWKNIADPAAELRRLRTGVEAR